MGKTYRGPDKKKKPQYRGKRDKRKELLDAFEKEFPSTVFEDVPEEDQAEWDRSTGDVRGVPSPTGQRPRDLDVIGSPAIPEPRDDDLPVVPPRHLPS